MDFKLNPDLNAGSLAKAYAAHKRMQIKNIFPRAQADATYKALATDTPWGLFYKGPEKGVRIPHDELAALPPDKLQEIYQYIFQSAASDYQFMYLFNHLSAKGRTPTTFLHHLADFMSSEPVLGFIRDVTGIKKVTHADAQATRFIGNCFLHPHTDEGAETGRRVAYVLNMTKNWDPNWGGYLQFFDEGMNVVQSFKPAFNALNIFTVPQGHAVSYVPPFCPGERLSITGWFRD